MSCLAVGLQPRTPWFWEFSRAISRNASPSRPRRHLQLSYRNGSSPVACPLRIAQPQKVGR